MAFGSYGLENETLCPRSWMEMNRIQRLDKYIKSDV